MILPWVRNKPKWLESGQLSASQSELRYWKETGLNKGPDIYKKYLSLFELDQEWANDKTIADIGCGPFGGVLSHLKPSQGIAIDILADDYNIMGKSPYPIQPYSYLMSVPSQSCDAVFCTNTLDHTTVATEILSQAYRIIKPGGIFCLHIHLRNKDELNKIHPIPWTIKKIRNALEPLFRITKLREYDSDPVNGSKYRTVILTAGKEIS